MATFDSLAGLPVQIDSYTLEGLDKQVSVEMERRTTIVHLHGGGHEGLGEDVGYDPDEQVRFQQAGPILALAGSRTLGELCEYVEQLELSAPDERSWRFRVWALESAALDLALRQGGRALPEVLGRSPEPMRYVASLRLGEPPTLAPVQLRLELDPTLRFKLDATSTWTPEIMEGLVATGAVDSIDFKGKYKGTVVDQGADPLLYRRVADAFPDAWLEDPDLDAPEAAAVLADEHARITWDAPIHGIADIEALPFPPRMVNIKPSRIGLLRELCETYDYCAARGIGAYGGGQTELGVGRGQAQYLAAIFHPDAPNDLAPAEYNQVSPPAGLPRSPLTAEFTDPGFRWPSRL